MTAGQVGKQEGHVLLVVMGCMDEQSVSWGVLIVEFTSGPRRCFAALSCWPRSSHKHGAFSTPAWCTLSLRGLQGLATQDITLVWSFALCSSEFSSGCVVVGRLGRPGLVSIIIIFCCC